MLNYDNKTFYTNITPNWARKNPLESISKVSNAPRELHAIIVSSKNVLSLRHVYNNLQNSCKKYIRICYT